MIGLNWDQIRADLRYDLVSEKGEALSNINFYTLSCSDFMPVPHESQVLQILMKKIYINVVGKLKKGGGRYIFAKNKGWNKP